MAFNFGSSFSQPAAASSSGFSFGAAAKPTFGFGTSQIQTTASLFGSTTNTTTSASTGFGTAGTTFGFGGQTASQNTLGGTFGLGKTLGQQPTVAAVDPNLLLLRQRAALTQPQIHGDERDGIIAKLNQLQAYWGTGKGFYSQQEAVDFTPQNQFCRFKVIGYNQLPTASETDGFVSIQVKRKESEVRQQQQALVETLHKALGSKPTLMVCVEGVKPLPDDRTEVVIYVVERQQNGSSKIYSASDVATFFNHQNVKAQLQNIGMESFLAKTSMSPAQLQKYLDQPAAGIHPLLWEQAKKDNPDPQKLIPVPITGFNELKKRLKYQEQETLQHQKRLTLISEEAATLQHNHATTMAKLAQFKRKHQELSHRVLEVMIKQESVRKTGYSVQADEEQLRVQLESIQAELNAPLQFKARLNELMSQIRLQQSQSGTSQGAADGKYVMDTALQEELKQHIEQQQMGLMHLISVIKEDVEDLKTIEQGLSENMTSIVRG